MKQKQKGNEMGRELRMVPPNWEHPRKLRQLGEMGYIPMYDRRFEDAASEWKTEFAKWERGEFPSYASEEDRALEFWEWHGSPPDRESYRPWKDEEAVWYQVWETISEGTPVTPPFETKEELIEYLVANGDFWDQQRWQEGCAVMNCEPWSRKQAERFVNDVGWAPSLVVDSEGVHSGVEALCGSSSTKDPG